MELLKICAVCVIMALSQLGLSNAETRMLVAGDPQEIICEPGITVAGLLTGNVHLLVKHNENGNDDVVFRNINHLLEAKYPEAQYKMKLITVKSMASFHYNFTALKPSDSGVWQCVTEIDQIKSYYKNVTFHVEPAQDVGSVELTLTKVKGGKETKLVHQDGDAGPTSSSVTLLSGVYTLSCMAESGYPKPGYKLYRDGNLISTDNSVTLNLTTADTNIGCKVAVPRPEFNEHTVMFNLKVKNVDPKINCKSANAEVAGGRAVMNCTVVAEDVTCSKVQWKSGTTNDTYKHTGSKVRGFDLSCQSNGKNSVWSALEVRNLNEQHFADSYFILITDNADGTYQIQEPLRILRKPGALNGAAEMVPLGSLTLVAVVTLLKLFL
ncbi:uncharacterized protein [Argopecten irradians]|uniref:uncharacterized protein n=1 Tax=Argopecten irradians TaxID=31199 RepID=UPI0037223630